MIKGLKENNQLDLEEVLIITKKMILLGMFYKSNIINIRQFGKSAKIID